MKKPRVVFPYTEAGFGHIMPLNSIADKFEELYGDKVECVRSNFFTETDDKKLNAFGKILRDDVIKSNKSTFYGYFQTVIMWLARTRLSLFFTMTFLTPGSKSRGIKHMDGLAPDLVVSTHFSTNYYAKKCKCKPLTALYFPDIVLNPVYRYPCDLTLMSPESGYKRALKCRRFNKDNLKRVPFLIRKEAYSAPRDKAEARRKLGLDENKFTILLAEGSNGIGKMTEICKIILQRDLPVNLIAVCGKNKKLYEKFSKIQSRGNTHFYPVGLADNMFELLAAADIFCGKSGANMSSEVCFFGLPHIITKYATLIEKSNGEYYINEIGNAMKIFKPKKVVDKIEEFMKTPELMLPYRKAAEAHRSEYGAEESAKLIFELLCTKFPGLR